MSQHPHLLRLLLTVHPQDAHILYIYIELEKGSNFLTNTVIHGGHLVSYF